ncbi:alpha mannosidase-like protein, partial [Ascosphaera acerosa]
MDSLSAYFPGLLTLAGDVDAGAEAHILNAAIWSKYSGLPERWNIATGEPEPGMAFWG